MNAFQDVTLAWAGAEYRIPANRVLPVVARLEAVIDGVTKKPAVQALTEGASIALISLVYEDLLEQVGADVRPGEVYLTLMAGMAAQDPSLFQQIHTKQLELLALMAPPIHASMLNSLSAGPADAKK